MNEKIQKRLEEIEARAEKATPGPWAYGEAETEQWVEADDGLVVYREYYTKPDPAAYRTGQTMCCVTSESEASSTGGSRLSS